MRKVSSISHAPEVSPGWFEETWLEWDTNFSLEDVHPVWRSAHERLAVQPLHQLTPGLWRLHLR
ncbi:unnamed protein product, partial [Phaeothamnion confervicola]